MAAAGIITSGVALPDAALTSAATAKSKAITAIVALSTAPPTRPTAIPRRTATAAPRCTRPRRSAPTPRATMPPPTAGVSITPTGICELISCGATSPTPITADPASRRTTPAAARTTTARVGGRATIGFALGWLAARAGQDDRRAAEDDDGDRQAGIEHVVSMRSPDQQQGAGRGEEGGERRQSDREPARKAQVTEQGEGASHEPDAERQEADSAEQLPHSELPDIGWRRRAGIPRAEGQAVHDHRARDDDQRQSADRDGDRRRAPQLAQVLGGERM